MARRPITTRMPLNEPEANPDWQAGQEWVRTNALAKVLEARRAFHEKTAQDAANYILAQGGSPEAAQAAYREVMSGFARSELMATSVLPIGPKGAGAASAPAREAQLALPAPRYAPGSAASRAANVRPMTLNEQRLNLARPTEETYAALQRPVTGGPAPGSAADIAANRPMLSLDAQRADMGIPPAEQVRREAMMPPPRGPAPGSAADIGAQRNANWAAMTDAEKRRALGLPQFTEADLRATELARMADEGPVVERTWRPNAVAEYRLAGETAPRAAQSAPVTADIMRMQAPGNNYVMPRRVVDPVEVNSAKTLARLEAASGEAGSAGSTLERTAQPSMRDIGGQSAGSSPSYGPYNFTLNTPPGRNLTLPILAGGAGLGAAGAGAYLAGRGEAPAPTRSNIDPYQFTHMPSGPKAEDIVEEARSKVDPYQYSHGTAGMPPASTRSAAPQQQRAETPPQRPAPSGPSGSVGNLVRAILSGEDYQSVMDPKTGLNRRTVEGGKPIYGNPELASDFFRADKARMEMGEGRAAGGRTGSPKPDAVHKALEIIHHLIMKG